MRKILREQHYPYRAHVSQSLRERDYERRLQFCTWAIGQELDDPDFFKFVLFTDEAGFTSHGIFNRQNVRHWAEENPGWVVEVDRQNHWRVNVWAGVLNDRVIGPWFFEGNMDRVRYEELLTNILPELLEDVPLAIRLRMWWQQDGHPAHTARSVRDILNQRFPNRVLALHGTIPWPARSPDLTPLDFFVWGTIKNIVYRTEPTTEDDMRERIRGAFATITPGMLRRTRSNFTRRVELCVDREGAHIEHLIKRWNP